MTKLSICIPTYNRPDELINCLNSIYIAHKNFDKFNFEICISDNGSNYNILNTIKHFKKKFKKKIKIKFNKFNFNQGVSSHYITVLHCIYLNFSLAFHRVRVLIYKRSF